MIPSQLPIVALATRPGALQALALQPGQMLDGKVLGTASNGAMQVQIGRQTINVTLPTPVPAGTSLQLQAQGSGAQQRLVLVSPVQGNTPAQPAGASAVQVQASQPNPAQAALAQMVQAAVPRQDSIVSLTSTLAAVVGKVGLPQPVVQAAQQVLASSLPLSGTPVTGTSLQQAMAASGIFQEASLAQGTSNLAGVDLKGALLALRGALTTWLGQAAAAASVTAPLNPLPPPVKGAQPRARSPAAVSIPETPEVAGKLLLERTEGSLARLRLHQHASLPEPMAAKQADWSMDIPVLIGGYQSAMQLQIHRDDAGSDAVPAERGWQIRFAMDVPALGEVGAQVGLRGGATSIRLWASDPATTTRFQQAVAELAQALLSAGLQPSAIIVRPAEPAVNPAGTGHFLDART